MEKGRQRVERMSYGMEEVKKGWYLVGLGVVNNGHASCKVFLDAASSETMYQHVTMHVIPLVSFLFYLDRPERRFIDRCVEAGNADAILRQGLTEYFWIIRRDIGMELLSRAWTEGSVEAGYLSLPCCYCVITRMKKKCKGVLKC
nr:uncharacterized protein LOC112749127 [Arachis hypogaea]